MYNPQVLSIFNKLEKHCINICHEIDDFLGNISNWADELGGVIESEFTAIKESTAFLLPKTPSEKQTLKRRGRPRLTSKCSVIDSIISQDETFDLDNTTTIRTRAAKRAAVSKISQINCSLRLPSSETSKMEISVSKKRSKGVSNATFVLPKASTRTKPVLKAIQQEPPIRESRSNKNEVLSTSSRNSQKDSYPEGFTGFNESALEVPPPLKTSRILNISPVKQPSPKDVPAKQQTPKDSPAKSQTPKDSPAKSQTPKDSLAKSQTPKESPAKSQTPKDPPAKSQTPKNSSAKSQTPKDAQTNETIPKDSPITDNELPSERSSRRKSSRTLSGSPGKRNSRSKLLRSQSGSPFLRSSNVAVARSPSNSPVTRSTSLRSSRNSRKSAVARRSNSNTSSSQDRKASTRNYIASETITIKKESSRGLSNCVVNETIDSIRDEERTPIIADDVEKTQILNDQDDQEVEMREDLFSSTRIIDVAKTDVGGTTFSVNSESIAEEDVQVPKKKRKVKKDEEVKENVDEMADTVRITRTKSKAIKKMMEENETKQTDLSSFAKKLLNRAKMTSLKKNQLAALLECNSATPTNGPGHQGSVLPFGNLTASKSKYHLLLSGSKKLKTPLATLPNSAMKLVKASEDKDRYRLKVAGRDSSVENLVRTVTKPSKDDHLEKEIKLQSKKEKEKEAALKRQNVIKTKQEELKRKNELKHQMAMKQREKLEQEKYLNMIQSEKEKEERHKLILQERQIKLKEEAFKKKMLTQQKIAETVERRRLEEEARLAKLKEMEAEEQRQALERQKEQERQEKRAQERLAQKKAREEYELQLKQELEAERLRAEKLLTAKKCITSASKLQSASKRQKLGLLPDRRDWDYKPRNENDYGLENEHSEIDSDDERSSDKTKPAVAWGKKIMSGKSPVVKVLTLEMLCEYLPCYQKSPDIYKMFRMTPSKRIKRSSSAIWNTPSS